MLLHYSSTYLLVLSPNKNVLISLSRTIISDSIDATGGLYQAVVERGIIMPRHRKYLGVGI